jgi:hypothetical protein
LPYKIISINDGKHGYSDYGRARLKFIQKLAWKKIVWLYPYNQIRTNSSRLKLTQTNSNRLEPLKTNLSQKLSQNQANRTQAAICEAALPLWWRSFVHYVVIIWWQSSVEKNSDYINHGIILIIIVVKCLLWLIVNVNRIYSLWWKF